MLNGPGKLGNTNPGGDTGLFLAEPLVGIVTNFLPGVGYLHKSKEMRWVLCGRQFRDSAAVDIIPIRVKNEFKHAHVRIISGEADLLLRMRIIPWMDVAVYLRTGQFQGGQSEWRTMTSNAKNRRAYPLIPNACDINE